MPVPHLLLVNLGTPDAPTAASVRRFLSEFLCDPDVIDFPRWFWQPILQGIILRTRPAKVARAYESIWTPEGSPLRASTERMVAQLRAQADGRFTVSAAYRYGEPSIDAMKRPSSDATATQTGPEPLPQPQSPRGTCSQASTFTATPNHSLTSASARDAAVDL